MKIGIVGYGHRISSFMDSVIGYDDGVEIAAITEIDRKGAEERLKEKGIESRHINFYEDADDMLEKEHLDGVLIGTRCSVHSKMAIKVLRKNLTLFLEKPVATCMKDLTDLKNAAEESNSRVVVSFPLRGTPLISLAKEIISSGRLGTIEHVQAINNVPYGGVYFHNWYRNEDETGGLFLQKATHDFDYINYIIGIKPTEICAMASKQIFRGNMPAGLLCSDCDKYKECPESPYILKHFKNEQVQGDMCCFATDTGNDDSSSALIRYETGMHVSYSQNFFARKGAAYRGARFLGYKGTLEFNWYTDELKVFMHDTSRTEIYKTDSAGLLHFGGDRILAHNFINVMRGTEESLAPIEAGLLSTLMCMKARQSAQTSTFQKIEWN